MKLTETAGTLKVIKEQVEHIIRERLGLPKLYTIDHHMIDFSEFDLQEPFPLLRPQDNSHWNGIVEIDAYFKIKMDLLLKN